MLEARSIATLGIGYGAAHAARLGLLARTIPPPDRLQSGGWLPAGKSLRRHPVRAEVLLRLGCSISSTASLRLGAAAAVDGEFRMKSTAGLRLSGSAALAAGANIAISADVHDVVLEMLLLAD